MDRQIEPRRWIERITSVAVPLEAMNPPFRREGPWGYGYLWWIWDGKFARDQFRGAFTAAGALGQYITVIPELDLVLAVHTLPGRDVVPDPRKHYAVMPPADYLKFVDSVVRARCSSVPCHGE